MAYTKYSLTPANNNAAPPDGAPEGMLPSAVNDTMRDMMAQIRDVGDGIRGGTYTMTAPVITGGSITGVALSGNTLTNPVITSGSINNTPIGASTANTGAFTTLASNGATTFTAGTASTTTTTGTAVITGGLGVSGRINAANFDGIVGANTAAAGNFTTLGATGVATFSAGTVSAPAITTTGDTNTGMFFPAADTIAFTEGGVESMRIDSSSNVGIGVTAPTAKLHVTNTGTSDSFLVEDSANPDSSPFVINNAGRVVSGYTTAIALYAAVTPQIQILGNGNSSSACGLARFSNDNQGNFVVLSKSRSATIGTYGTSVASGDSIGQIIWSGDDGTAPIIAAQITGQVDGTPGTNDMPGRLVFLTTADGASSVTERMRIDSAGNVGIGVTAPTAKLHVTNTGAGDSFLVEDSANPDSSPFVINSSGQVIVGYTQAVQQRQIETHVTTADVANQGVGSYNWGNNAAGGSFGMYKARGATFGTHTIVNSGDLAGRIDFFGSDGTTFIRAASIQSNIDGTPGTNDMPGRLTFLTTADGASSPTERMRIDTSGNVGIGATANASAILDVQSTTKGVRMPNMTTTQKNAIASPAAGLMVFDTTLAKLCVYSGSAWQTITSV